MTKQFAYQDGLNPELLICWCGYNCKEDYFKPCRRDGGVRKTRVACKYLGCIGCGRIINPRTLEIVGKQRRLIVGRAPVNVQELQFLGRSKQVAFWPVKGNGICN